MEMTGFGVEQCEGMAQSHSSDGSEGLGTGKRIFMCQPFSRTVRGLVFLSPDFPMGYLLPSGRFSLVLLPV